ncbi:hypothetical protein [Edwardsiella tarda]
MVRRETPAQICAQRVTLVGQLCTPKDVVARRQPISALVPGDWLVSRWRGSTPGTSLIGTS